MRARKRGSFSKEQVTGGEELLERLDDRRQVLLDGLSQRLVPNPDVLGDDAP
jgi:hypothetical protein